MKVKFIQCTPFEPESGDCGNCVVSGCTNHADNAVQVEIIEADNDYNNYKYSNKNFAWIIPVCQKCVNQKKLEYEVNEWTVPAFIRITEL